MFCPRCGRETDSDDNFCMSCGEVLKESAWEPEAKHDVCSIELEETGGGILSRNYRMWADAQGPEGRYQPIPTRTFKGGRSEIDGRHGEPRAVFNEMVRELELQGWQPLPVRGSSWYNLRFRKPRAGHGSPAP